MLTETYTINTNQASLQRANDSQERDSRNVETFTKVPSSRNSATSVHRDSVSSIHDTKAAGRSRTYEDTLKHYDGQTNLFDCKPTKKRGTTDEVFVSETEKRGDENAVANSSRVGLPPAMPRRCRRQPTIENPVCFQEVGGDKTFSCFLNSLFAFLQPEFPPMLHRMMESLALTAMMP